MNSLSPICLCPYDRLHHLKRTIEALKRNPEAKDSELFFFSDAPRTGDEERVAAVRRYLKTVTGFRSVEVIERSINNRAFNWSNGETMLLERYGRVISLEDDLVVAPGFLGFVNAGLDQYENDHRIFAVCGYTPGMRIEWITSSNAHLSPRYSGWGYGYWKRSHSIVPRRIADYSVHKNGPEFQERIFRMGDDYRSMLDMELNHRIDAGDVRTNYVMILNDMRVIAPTVSLVENIGFDDSGTHCPTTQRFSVDITRASLNSKPERNLQDDQRIFELLRRFRSESHRTQPWLDSELIDAISNIDPENAIIGQQSNLGEQMVFLLGLPRSGTTLLQRVLGGHSQIHTIAEPWIMLHFCYAIKRQGIETEYDASLARQGLDDFFLELPGGENTYINSIREMAGGLYKKALSTTGKTRFLDKTPRYFYVISELKKIFPRAKFVFLLRNPLAILASVLRSWFQSDAAMLRASSHHFRDLFEGPTYLMNGIDELADDAIVLQYEGLVNDPTTTVKALCELLELPFEEEMLDYGKQSKFKGQFGDQIGIVKHSTAKNDSLDRWQDDLIAPQSNALAHQLLDHLGPDLLARMGYSHAKLKESLDHITMEALKRDLPIEDVPVELRARFADSLCESGEEIYSEGKLDDAVQILLRASALDPRNPRSLNDLSVMLWSADERAMASHYVTKALTAAPTDRTTVLNYGDVMESQGQLASARAAYWNYSLSNPDDNEVLQRYLAMAPDVTNGTGDNKKNSSRVAASEENFAGFAYSKRSHFQQLLRHESQRDEDIDDCNLKVYQDMLAYNFILDNFPEGSRLLDIGGGDSRIIRWLKDRYEFWNLDKLEGLGNGLTNLENKSGFRLVRDYIGAFSAELPDLYFDGIFSISTLEHVPEDEATLKAICDDMNRVLKPGGLSMHCFDVLAKPKRYWLHPLIDFIHSHEPVPYSRIPEWKMRLDPDLWGMTRQGYNRTWYPVTKKPYEEFGMPISYNVIWRKKLEQS